MLYSDRKTYKPVVWPQETLRVKIRNIPSRPPNGCYPTHTYHLVDPAGIRPTMHVVGVKLLKFPLISKEIIYHINKDAFDEKYSPIKCYQMEYAEAEKIPPNTPFEWVFAENKAIELLRSIIYGFDYLLQRVYNTLIAPALPWPLVITPPYLPEKITADNLAHLVDLICNAPELFCFETLYEHYRIRGKPLVRQISHVEYEKICAAGGLNPRPKISLAIRIYHVLQRSYLEDKHFYITYNTLVDKLRTTDRVRDALSYLIRHRRIDVLENDRFRVTEVAIIERNINNGLTQLFTNAEHTDRLPFDEALAESLHPEQEQAYRHFCEQPLTVLTGAGGCGKTATIAKIIRRYAPQFQFVVISFQAKNVNDIRTACLKLVGNTSTVRKRVRFTTAHSFISYKLGGLDDEEDTNDNTNPRRIFIVEEASMMSPELFAEVLYSLSGTNTTMMKLVFLGDPCQLPPIQPGHLLVDLIKHIEHANVRLITNHRTTTSLPSTLLDPVRTQRCSAITFDNVDGFYIPSDLDNFTTNVLDIFQKHNLDHHTTQIISRTHDVCDRINELHGPKYGYGTIRIGAKILFKKNFDKVGIFTNAIYFVDSYHIRRRADDDSEVRLIVRDPTVSFKKLVFECSAPLKIDIVLQSIDTPNKRIVVPWMREYVKFVRPAYCCTIHASQGSQFDNVIYILPKFSPFETQNIVYTAFSRAKEKIFFLGGMDRLEKAILTPEPARNVNFTETFAALNDLIVSTPFEPITRRDNGICSNDAWENIWLPSEIWISIFGWAAYSEADYGGALRSIFGLRMVSKMWRDTIDTGALVWRPLFEETLYQRCVSEGKLFVDVLLNPVQVLKEHLFVVNEKIISLPIGKTFHHKDGFSRASKLMEYTRSERGLLNSIRGLKRARKEPCEVWVRMFEPISYVAFGLEPTSTEPYFHTSDKVLWSAKVDDEGRGPRLYDYDCVWQASSFIHLTSFDPVRAAVFELSL